MPDQSSAPPRDAALDDGWDPEELDSDAAAPRGSRRRLVTPLSAGLCGLLLATAGFIAGVQVQKGQGDGGGASPSAGGGALASSFPLRGGDGGRAAGGGTQGGDAPTVGTVANKKGGTLYVERADGTTVRVKTNAQSKVTRNAAASPRGIYPGDTVVVQGTKDKDGDIVGTRITATSQSAAASGGGGLRQAFGGGAPDGGTPRGGAPADVVVGG